MAGVPFAYNVRGLVVRRMSTALTVLGIAATVAVLAGLLSLQRGFSLLFKESGREDVAVFLRPGATSEGESAFPRRLADILVKETPEVALAEDGSPLAAAEVYLAVRLFKQDGGETNVPIRGVEPASFALRGDDVRIVEGKRMERGADELIVGRALTSRIRGAAVGEVIVLNTTPFRVVGVFDHDGPFASEVWGDADRIMEALQRPVFSRVVAQLRPDADLEELALRMESDKRVPAKVKTERDYMTGLTKILSGVLLGLGAFLAVVMGVGAVFTGTNTMLAALASRSHEIGILLSIGFRPLSVFLAFLRESLLLGLVGGVVGALAVLPLNGIRTGTTNFQTFTEVAFAFRVTPDVLAIAVGFAVLLGLFGGAWPAWRAARLEPTEALRRG